MKASSYLRYKKSASEIYVSKNPLENYMQMSRHRVVKSLLKKYSKNSANIIDIGCGTGVYLNYLELQNFDCLIGIDLNILDLKKAIKRGCTEYIQGSVEHLPFKEKSLDLVLFSETLEHLSDPIKGLEEILRILKINGTLIISTPTKKGIYENKEFVYVYNFLIGIWRLFHRKSFKTPYEEHISLHTVKELKNKLYDLHFKILEEHYAGFCIPLFGEVLKFLLRTSFLKRIYDILNVRANKSNLLRDYNWNMIFVAKKYGK